MQLSPQSHTMFQSLFLEKEKEHINNILQYKQTLAIKARQRFVKNQIDRPNTSMQQKTNSDTSQIYIDNHRKISMNESQLTVVTIRKPQQIMHTIELSPQVKPLTSIVSQRPHRYLIEKPTFKSPESQKQLFFKQKQYRNKLQLKQKDNDQKLKVCAREIRSNSRGVQEYIKYQDEMDEYFQDKLFLQQKQIAEKLEYFKMNVKKLDQKQLEPIGKLLELKLLQMKKKY